MPAEKPKKDFKRITTLILAYIIFCVAGGIIASGFLLPGALMASDTVKKLTSTLSTTDNVTFSLSDLPQQSRMYASDGTTLIATFYDQNRINVPLSKVSKVMQQAVVAREDRRFFKHSGVDPTGILRAFLQTYVHKGGGTQGGSTLTQQYVKNMLIAQAQADNDPIEAYHAQEDTIARKIREMLLALQIEKKYSKADILQGYLNIAQFGVNTFGVETAAQHYFSKSAADLDAGEAATIASITKNPTKYDPTVNVQNAQEQRNIVLDLMVRSRFISQQEAAKYKAVPLQSVLKIKDIRVGCQAAGGAAYFCDYVVHRILNSPAFGKTRTERRRLLYAGGLNIVTTMDVNAEDAANAAVRKVVPEDDKSGFEAVMAAVQPGTGKVLAIAQNRTYGVETNAGGTTTSINYAVDQIDGGGIGVQTGSTFKPINMVSWLSNGHKAMESLRTSTAYPLKTFPCAPVKSGIWSVQNSGGGTVNPETPYNGLIMSHNTTQAAMAQKIGLCAITKTAQTLGYHNSAINESDLEKQMQVPMIIGALNASPLTMANVYATIAANGVRCDPIAITKVTKNGRELAVPSAGCKQAISKEVAQTTAYILNKDVTQGVAKDAQLAGGRKTFAKTGTAEDKYMDSVIFTNGVAAYTTMGNMERPVSFTRRTVGGRTYDTWYGAYTLPILTSFMNDYVKAANIPDDPNYGQPDPSLMG